MKTAFFYFLLVFVLMACSNSTEEKNKTVDTTIGGSDSTKPAPDTMSMNKKPDSPGR